MVRVNGLLGVALLAAAVTANSRAPRVVPGLPSTAPRAISQDVVVDHETLSFRCDKARCRVKAHYRVRAGSAQQVELRFVVPIPAPVTARFGAAKGTVNVVGATAITKSETLARYRRATQTRIGPRSMRRRWSGRSAPAPTSSRSNTSNLWADKSR